VLSRPVVAQSEGNDGGGGGISVDAIREAVVAALREVLRSLFVPIEGVIETHGPTLLRLIIGTPHPDRVLDAPIGLPWFRLYQYYWSTIVPLAVLLFGLAVGLVIFLETTSHLFSSYHRTNLKRRAFSGLLGILSWWWLAALSLQLTDQLAGLLAPDLGSVSLFQTLSFSAMGLLGLIASLSVDITVFVLLALLYLARRLVLYGFVLGMPLLMAAWIPGVGPFSLLSRFAKRLAGFYVPFLLMPVPIALLLRLAALLGDAATLSMGGFGAWVTALVIPFVAVVVPFVLVWQAGAVLFVADRFMRRTSRRQLTTRLERGRDVERRLNQGGRKALHGIGDNLAVDRERQPRLSPGTIRTRGQRLGGRVRSTATRLRTRFQNAGGGDDSPQFDPGRWEVGRYDPDRFEPREYDTSRRTNTTDDRTDE
jgi:hypothetical protein